MDFEKGDRYTMLVKVYFIEDESGAAYETYPVDARLACTNFPNQHRATPWTDAERAAYAKLSDEDKVSAVFKLGPKPARKATVAPEDNAAGS